MVQKELRGGTHTSAKGAGEFYRFLVTVQGTTNAEAKSAKKRRTEADKGIWKARRHCPPPFRLNYPRVVFLNPKVSEDVAASYDQSFECGVGPLNPVSFLMSLSFLLAVRRAFTIRQSGSPAVRLLAAIARLGLGS